jgi:putative ABC transport system permease protein
MRILLRLLGLPLAFLRLGVQSALLALGQVWANKARSVLTMIGIIIGVASVTTVIAVLSGLKANVLREFEALGTNKIFINARWPETGPKRMASWLRIRFTPEQFDNLLDHCPSVAQFTRVQQTSTDVRYGQESVSDVQIIGIEPAWHQIENRAVLMGRPFTLVDEEHNRNVCLIVPKVRDKLKLDRECVGQSIFMLDRSFLIVGVVEERLESSMFGEGGERLNVFIPFSTMGKLRRGWMWAMATSRSPQVSEEAQAELQFFLRRTRKISPGEEDTFHVETVEQSLRQFNTVAATITAIAAGIVGISLLVGGVGIMNIMLVSVSERTREIGLRKAVGARPTAIMLQFLVEAVMLCCIGGAIGVLSGYGLTAAMAMIPHAKLEQSFIPMWSVALSFGFSTLVGVVFGMFPAVKAAQLDPIEALRHE